MLSQSSGRLSYQYIDKKYLLKKIYDEVTEKITK